MNLLSAIGESGHLLSIERRHDFAQIAASNVDCWFGRHHPAWELRAGDFNDVVGKHVLDASVDRIVLDMLAPWDCVAQSARALAPGGVFLAYVPPPFVPCKAPLAPVVPKQLAGKAA
ncbi:tRNA (adenine(58)-N(1))-methyltransferase TrmI [Actinomyces bovis]|uniref:tRNA (Adenine(58)-N(1))-methyltransferase TrmI n=2 Tax=Actinomyces bovis TaxID=1658 RepID=A0ABY1VMY0_9ACTO|nr:tRNA (adenine(58)-N(1))-methyltransferase TrmI [Actinomyces bovis]